MCFWMVVAASLACGAYGRGRSSSVCTSGTDACGALPFIQPCTHLPQCNILRPSLVVLYNWLLRADAYMPQ